MLKSTSAIGAAYSQNQFNPIKIVYLLLTVLGSILPWLWILQDPTALFSLTLFLQKASANNIASDLGTDLLISSDAFLCFLFIELKRLEASRLWMLLYIGLAFGVGLSCALPLFLYHREQILERNALSLR